LDSVALLLPSRFPPFSLFIHVPKMMTISFR
jgi:hypothetical protein